MSAFVVSKTHIDLLVDVVIYGPRDKGGRWSMGDIADHMTANDIGEMLVSENVRSVHARYPDTIDNPDATPGPLVRYWEEPYRFQRQLYRLSVVETLRALACYEYQSCESADWERTDAFRSCQRLRHVLIRAMPGYDDAPWEWTPEEVGNAVARYVEARR